MMATINWANRVCADVEAHGANCLAPTSGAKALALYAHAVAAAICIAKGLIPVGTMLIFTILSKPFAFAFTSTNGSIPMTIGRIATWMQMYLFDLRTF